MQIMQNMYFKRARLECNENSSVQNSRILCVVKFYLVNNLLHCHSALAAQWARELPPRLARARFSLRSCDVDEFPWRRDNKGISTVVVFIRHLSESLATRQSFDFDLTPSWKDTFDLHLSLLGLSILKVITLNLFGTSANVDQM